MSLIQKYIWVVKTIHRAGRITLKELNEKWRNNVDLSRGEDLPRQTFDRWKGGILDMFGIVIECEAKGGYHYYIANPSVMDRGELRTWLLDTYGTAEALSNNLAIHDRILTEDIPSSQDFFTMVLEAMKENRVLEITHRAFTVNEAKTYLVEPYCVKLSAGAGICWRGAWKKAACYCTHSTAWSMSVLRNRSSNCPGISSPRITVQTSLAS